MSLRKDYATIANMEQNAGSALPQWPELEDMAYTAHII